MLENVADRSTGSESQIDPPLFGRSSERGHRTERKKKLDQQGKSGNLALKRQATWGMSVESSSKRRVRSLSLSTMEAFDHTAFLKFLAALLALVNPLFGVPVFLAMTEGYTPAERRRTALTVTAAVTITAVATVMIGEEVLGIFGIAIPAFRIAGGVIILGLGLAMLNSEVPDSGETSAIAAEQVRRKSIAIVPLAIPMTIGPGAIVTIIVFAHEMDFKGEVFTLVPAVLLVSAMMGMALLLALPISRLIGSAAIGVVTKIMAIILVAVAIEMIVSGTGDALDERYPQLLKSISGS
jgi:multiple antibiotic resistance protein